MRQARLTRTAGMAEKAQIMAHERSINMTNEINQKTDRSIDRHLEANRSMERYMALDSSILARQGKSIPGQTISKEIVQQSHPKIVEKDRETIEVTRKMVSKRRTQVDHAAKSGEDSIPPNARKALEKEAPRNQNDVQPRFHPQSARPVPGSRLVAHGINGNPAEEARRRKKLEARIKELAAN